MDIFNFRVHAVLIHVIFLLVPQVAQNAEPVQMPYIDGKSKKLIDIAL